MKNDDNFSLHRKDVGPSNEICPKICRLCTDGFRNRCARFSAIFFQKRRGTRCESLVRSVPDRGGQKFFAEKTDYISIHCRAKVGPVSAPPPPLYQWLWFAHWRGGDVARFWFCSGAHHFPCGAMCHPLAPQARPSSAWDAFGGGQKRRDFT